MSGPTYDQSSTLPDLAVRDAGTRPGTRTPALSLRQGQIDTPDELVRFTWERVHARRPAVGTVLDLGAGQANFAAHGQFRNYVGYESDSTRAPTYATSKRRVLLADALDATGYFDIVIGNPPYVRNQDIDTEWQRRAVATIEDAIQVTTDERANQYVYFMWLGLLRCRVNGLLAQVVPADWLVRPSARHLRDYIKQNGWHVAAYLFVDGRHFFRSVKTNISLTIIDKASSEPWEFFAVNNALDVTRKSRPTVLRQSPRGAGRADVLRAGRGLSPGSQKIFVLTEQQRLLLGIRRTSVVPCITTLRGIPRHTRTLSEKAFKRLYVEGGRRCWLLDTERPILSETVIAWLNQTPKDVRDNQTCRERERWFSFKLPPIPDILYGSGFRAPGPRFLVNEVQARAVGSVHGIFNASDARSLAHRLRTIDFARTSIRYAGNLLKIEVSQMNRTLARLSRPETVR